MIIIIIIISIIIIIIVREHWGVVYVVNLVFGTLCSGRVRCIVDIWPTALEA